MGDLTIRSYAFEHAVKLSGPGATLAEVLAAAEAIFRFLVEDRSTLTTKH